MSKYPVYKNMETCERCHKPIEKERAIWFELNSRTGLYQAPGTVPQRDSQGGFAFGSDCAKVVALAGGKCHYIGLAKENNK